MYETSVTNEAIVVKYQVHSKNETVDFKYYNCYNGILSEAKNLYPV